MSAPPYKVKAVFEYKSPHEDDLSFANGQIITVTEEEDADWYVGEYADATGNTLSGLFPKNFVERYEPEAPPRPTRSRPKKEGPATTTAAPAPAPPLEPTVHDPEPISEEPSVQQSINAQGPVPTAKSAAAPTASNLPKSAPPPVADKPSSFKDRIAAFNKPSAPPIAPKPGASAPTTSSGFIKKPFVAPPPSRDAYISPPARDVAPQKVYRRDEDPEIAETQAQYQEEAERAGLVRQDTQEDPEDAAKPTSLRDRIALLQKQQQEQAARRAEKPKRPVRRRTESTDQLTDPVPGAEGAELEKTTSSGSNQPRVSSDSTRDTELARPPPIRKPSHTREVSQDILSDGNEADQSGAGDTTEDADAESTEVEDAEEKPKSVAPPPPPRTSTGSSRPLPPEPSQTDRSVEHEEDQDREEDDEEEEEEEEEEELDEETRRKIALRERMAKMSGGVGMHGMVAMPLPTPMATSTQKKRGSQASTQAEQLYSGTSPPLPQSAPLVPVPGMQRAQSPESMSRNLQVEEEPDNEVPVTAERPPDVIPDLEDVKQLPPQQPPSVPDDRTDRSNQRAVPPPPTTARLPQPPPRPVAAEDSNHEVFGQTEELSSTVESEVPGRTVPPVPVPSAIPPRPEGPRSPPQPSKRTSHLSESGPANDQTSQGTRPQSMRAPPPVPAPVPAMPPAPATEVRSPPPPPPPTAAPPSRRSTDQNGLSQIDDDDDAGEDGESEYEGDYDTDIAPGQSHKNALAHNRERSLDDSTLSEDTKSPVITPAPPQPTPRAAPPPPPPNQPEHTLDDSEYDPFRYTNQSPGVLPTHRKTRVPIVPVQESSDQMIYGSPPASGSRPPPPPVPQSPPPQPYESPNLSAPRKSQEASRPSIEAVRRTSLSAARKSTDQPRQSMEQGYIARDVDLATSSLWWMSPNTPPPVFQKRNDILCEFEESSTAKRGGRTSISKDVYILFHDYSQTIIAARFDPKVPSDVTLEQRHELPPPKPRQDQLEEAYSKFGQAILASLGSKQNTTVGDGSPQALVLELLKSQANTLMPVGTRAYGALVYANMANATVSQVDEIRPGDIISFRNAKFSGKHGAMHAKYSEDVGKPEHVGIVTEWDGTKKKVRALEQGRESKKAKIESFRVGDLRSGEVKVWRVMGRNWVGWE